jgi:hypothetical protein
MVITKLLNTKSIVRREGKRPSFKKTQTKSRVNNWKNCENHYGPDLAQAFPAKFKLETLMLAICINM